MGNRSSAGSKHVRPPIRFRREDYDALFAVMLADGHMSIAALIRARLAPDFARGRELIERKLESARRRGGVGEASGRHTS